MLWKKKDVLEEIGFWAGVQLEVHLETLVGALLSLLINNRMARNTPPTTFQERNSFHASESSYAGFCAAMKMQSESLSKPGRRGLL